MNKEKVHSPFGPSNYPAWEQCCHYDSDDNERSDSELGTKIHEEAEDYLVLGREPDNATARWFGDTILQFVGEHFRTLSVEVRLSNRDGDIWGYADVVWIDNRVLHIADFKSFSDGTKDYSAQLCGYGSLFRQCRGFERIGEFMCNTKDDDKIVLHILHGMSRQVETIETTYKECDERVASILSRRIGMNAEPRINSYCQFCKHIKECKAVNNAVQTVSDNSVTFNELNLCQKLVVLDAVDKLSKSIREEAKRIASENGGSIEMTGIKYELKPWGGKSVCSDLCALAGDVSNPVYTRIDDEAQEAKEIPFNGIDGESLIKLCDLPKTRLISELKERNKGGAIKSKEIEQWVNIRYEKTEGSPHFVRTK